MLRENFEQIRFIVPANAFSATTMMSFACDSILMTDSAALGPIDPQLNGIPARTILRGFEDLERRLKEEGPEALAAYIDLLKDYSLHLLEICKSAELLSKRPFEYSKINFFVHNWCQKLYIDGQNYGSECSFIIEILTERGFQALQSHYNPNYQMASKELAADWLSKYMLKCDKADVRVQMIVNYFADYDTHKSHGRSIGREKAIELGLLVEKVARGTPLDRLIRGLNNQLTFFLSRTDFFKVYENAHGCGFGRRWPQQIGILQSKP